jgi:predicted dehydrogenase
VSAFCQRDRNNADSVANEFNIPHVFTDYHDLLDLRELDAVSIATPTYTHHQICLDSVKMKKHVLCEKPLAMNTLEAQEMVSSAENAGITHMIGFEFRYIPAVRYMKQLIDQGYVGQAFQVHVRGFGYHRLDPEGSLRWEHRIEKAPAGILSAIGAHLIDTIRWIIGNFKSVCGSSRIFIQERPVLNTSKKGNVTTDDEFAFLAELKGGVQAVFHFSGVATREHSIEIYGNKGALKYILERESPRWILGKLFGTRDPHRKYKSIPIPTQFTNQLKTKDMMKAFGTFLYGNLCRDFVHGIRNKEQPVPNFHDGLEVQKILEAAIVSNKQRRWIPINS